MAKQKNVIITAQSENTNIVDAEPYAANGMFYSTDDVDYVEQSGRALDKYCGISQLQAARDTYRNIDSNTSVRVGFNRDDYDYFRPNEAIPRQMKEIIGYCMEAYRQVGLVRNIIDLMSDFCSQGIRLVHPDKKIQDFYQAWFEQAQGPERTERIANLFYRAGIAPIQRHVQYLTVQNSNKLYKSKAAHEDITEIEVEKRELPWRYTILNPLTLEVLDDVGSVMGKPNYGIKLPENLLQKIKFAKTPAERELIAQLPDYIKRGLSSQSNGVIPLDMKDMAVFYYKKDDWQVWADPMIRPILKDLGMLEKLKLADLAALDGAISQVRLWTLGDLENRILPSDASIAKLSNILLSNPGGGSYDIVWGPDLKFTESASTVHQFLGSEKYISCLDSIYGGLGIPQTVTGSKSQGGGMTNNYLAIKTLTERLEYGRKMLVSFWMGEIVRVQKAMGYKKPAMIKFDRINMADEAAEKALLIQLVDRNILSPATLLEYFDEIPEMETVNLKKEQEAQRSGLTVTRLTSLQNNEAELTKLAMQNGGISPKDAGVPKGSAKLIKPPAPKAPIGAKKKAVKGKSGQGRPTGSKDSSRKKKVVKPQRMVKSSEFIDMAKWAIEAQETINSLMNPYILAQQKDKQLSASELNNFEILKFWVLSNLNPYTEIEKSRVYNLVSQGSGPTNDFVSEYNSTINQFILDNQRLPKDQDLVNIRAILFTKHNFGENDG